MGSNFYFRKWCWNCAKNTNWEEIIGRASHIIYCGECTLTYDLHNCNHYFAMTEDEIYELALNTARRLYFKK